MARVRLIAVNIAVLAAILIVIEGLAGYGSFVRGYLWDPDFAERRHTRYDPLLGWSNVPGVHIPDMYGTGIGLRINAQGFRSDRDFARQVAAGRIRIICSGDSYALGYGVADDRTWCHRLMAHDPRLETVNMGQGGYGVDQAYLWYRRDGGALDHQFQILMFITEDLGRMAEPQYGTYGKPVLVVEQGELSVAGTPVPGPSQGWVRRIVEQSKRLRTVGAIRRIREFTGLDHDDRPRHASLDETRGVAAAVLRDLQRLNQERGSTLVLVHAPVEDDLRLRDQEAWVSFVEREAGVLGIPFFQLLDEFARLPPEQLSGMFIKEGVIDYPGSVGHYTDAGNELVARLIYERMAGHLERLGQ